MEDVVAKLQDVNSALNGIVCILAIFMLVSLFAFLVLFFWYYDVSKKDERKRLRKQIEREIKEESDSNGSQER